MIKTIHKKWDLYIITDEKLSGGRSHVDIAKSAISGGADVIQLRDKTASSLKLYQTGLAIRKLCREAGVIYIVNDRLDIALATDADGLHVGQDDLPADVARRLLGPQKILGVSARNTEEAVQSEKDGADYLGVGPIFEARSTKSDTTEPQNLSLLSSARKHCRKPIIAIGGVKPENAREVIRAGAHGIAVISAVVTAPDIEAATKELKSLVLMEK